MVAAEMTHRIAERARLYDLRNKIEINRDAIWTDDRLDLKVTPIFPLLNWIRIGRRRRCSRSSGRTESSLRRNRGFFQRRQLAGGLGPRSGFCQCFEMATRKMLHHRADYYAARTGSSCMETIPSIADT